MLRERRFLLGFGMVTGVAALTFALVNGIALAQEGVELHPVRSVLLSNLILALLTLAAYSILFQRFTGYYPLANVDAVAAERQTKIRAWLHSSDHPLTVAALGERLGVPLERVYADIYELVRHGEAQKLPCGVTLPDAICEQVAICEQDKHQRASQADAAFIFELPTQPLYACCAHTGLLVLKATHHRGRILTRDFLYGHMIDARRASYLIRSEVAGCPQGSVVALASVEDAQRLQQGFGGQVVAFDRLGAVL